ncbi:putative zinc-binding metallopeptidase [bacterium]|nr:putative zinc-binding metallopeptidase [bacterium]
MNPADSDSQPSVATPNTFTVLKKKRATSTATPATPAKITAPVKNWTKLSDEKLLDMRMCDLDLKIESTPLEGMVGKLHDEITAQKISLKPHCWLSDEWFAPDGIPGIGIPFYLAHPRLMKLERQQMLDVEGGTKAWCMKILRHEAGHTMDTAYGLHRRKRYREVFGRYSDPYPEFYRPKPRSKNFVLHLEPWYAQSHPAEDFAETFAVWLTPGKRWQKDYAGWKAMKKLHYVDELMKEIAGTPPKVKSRRKVDPVGRMKKTLREHYLERHERYNINYTTSFDDDLARLFLPASSGETKQASSYLRKNRNEICDTISNWTGEYRYNINQVLREMIDRCRILNLRVNDTGEQLRHDTLIMVTVHTMNYLYRGNHQVAL